MEGGRGEVEDKGSMVFFCHHGSGARVLVLPTSFLYSARADGKARRRKNTERATSAAGTATLLSRKLSSPGTHVSHPFSTPHPPGLGDGARWSERANMSILS